MQSNPTFLDEAALPAHLRSKLPAFQTERFDVMPLNPAQARELAEGLLQDERLAEYVTWMEDKSRDGARREAFLLEMQCAAGTTLAWGIVDRDSATFIGALLARPTVEGLDLEVLCASAFWNQGIADETAEPVAEWMEANCEVEMMTPN
jgi:RimJ/RimL family protein N-acetyltransferase